MSLQKIPFSWTDVPAIGPEIIEALQRGGAAIVTGLPDEPGDGALMALATSLGSPLRHNDLTGGAEQNIVVLVRAVPDPVRDVYGREITSQTSACFDMHTDQYFSSQPAHIVLLHCVVPDPHGEGISLLCHIDDVVSKLTQDQLDLLQRPLYPHPGGRVAILEADRGTWLVRYNLILIQHEIENRRTITDCAREALSAFESGISVSQYLLALCAGDCLVVDNFRVLHGRTKFRADSPRLLKRLRLNNEKWPQLSDVVEEQLPHDAR